MHIAAPTLIEMRKGLATVELAICLPLIVIIAFRSIEAN